jgi:hypothetical protein
MTTEAQKPLMPNQERNRIEKKKKQNLVTSRHEQKLSKRDQ